MAKVLITGGLGFIGAKLADKLLYEENEVVIIDNMSRNGCKENWIWLTGNHSASKVQFYHNDVRDVEVLKQSANGADIVFHLAAQVSVTNSIKNPYGDFLSNATGTICVLEAARIYGNDPVVLYSSTNKVYGSLSEVSLEEKESRYEFRDLSYGIPESQPISFETPYGCSKGVGDQYVCDYYKTFNLRTIVMRQSCIYGDRQFGDQGQGWVSWFLIAIMLGLPLRIYGDGKQVRDLLFIDDLLGAYQMAIDNIAVTKGQIYNIGGGIGNAVSVWLEFKNLLEKLTSREVKAIHETTRLGDQKAYISDIRKAYKDFGWKPTVGIEQGIKTTFDWIQEQENIFKKLCI